LRGSVGRYESDAISDRDAGDVGTERFDDSCRLEAEARRKRRLCGRPAGAKRDLGAIDADGMDAEANLTGSGRANFDVFDAEDAGIAEFIQADGAGHDGKPSFSVLP
jgi:hypothetical protein